MERSVRERTKLVPFRVLRRGQTQAAFGEQRRRCIAIARHAALLAQRPARLAHVAAVQDQPVVRVDEKFSRYALEQLLLDGQLVCARCL